MPTIALESPAEIYETRFAPALFAHFGRRLVARLGIAPGARALDVACGTGAATIPAAEAAGPRGRVVGLDANPEMLAVARRKSAAVEWVEGAAERLPFEAAAFDAVLSQFGLMFFADRAAALREMARVLAPGGRLAVAVCGRVERSEGYAALAALLDRLFGRETGDAFLAPFVLGDEAALAALATEAGLAGAAVETIPAEVRFASIGDLVSTERACVWTLGGLLDDDQFARLADAAERDLAPWRERDGALRFTMPAPTIRWTKPA